MITREQYKQAWRQARLLKGAIIRDEREFLDWWRIHHRALELNKIPVWLGAVVREQLRQRDGILINRRAVFITLNHLIQREAFDPRRDLYDDSNWYDRNSRSEL